MLISKYVVIKWNPKICKHYIDLGYKYTKIGDKFTVKICDLTKGSSVLIKLKCDYCECEYFEQYQTYIRRHNTNVINNDCCKKCGQIKAKESIIIKYNTSNIRELSFVSEKIKNTNLQKYGSENPFGNDLIKEKIHKYWQDNYGINSSTQLPETIIKSQNTCLKKYGVKNYGSIYSSEHRGDLSPSWKGNLCIHDREKERFSKEYKEWRKSVFKRDNYICQCCGDRSGLGHSVILQAHHIENFSSAINKRYNLDNGITLCYNCHIKLFHHLYGRVNNNKEQLDEFIMNYNQGKYS